MSSCSSLSSKGLEMKPSAPMAMPLQRPTAAPRAVIIRIFTSPRVLSSRTVRQHDVKQDRIGFQDPEVPHGIGTVCNTVLIHALAEDDVLQGGGDIVIVFGDQNQAV